MQLALKAKPLRLALGVIECLVALLLIFWVGRIYLADVAGRKLDARDLAVAAQLDPGNSDYHLKLGRIYQYSLTDIDPARAIAELTRAAELNPLEPQDWLDLGAAQELQGQIDLAEASLRRADYLAPNLPGFQWAIANFFLLHGNVTEAVRHFKMVLSGVDTYNNIIFSTAWKALGNGDEILNTLIPNRIGAQIYYLFFLVGQNKLDEAAKVWKLIAANPQPFPLVYTRSYLDLLIGTKRIGEAYQVWRDLQKRGMAPVASGENLVADSDFETEPANLGFGWRILFAPGVYVARDASTYHSGAHSLVIRFPGNANLNYDENVFQVIKVTPGVHYQLRAFFKTDGITTDSGPRLHVNDPYDRRNLNLYSDQLTGTNAAWTPLTINFTPKAETPFVQVGIARVPSDKIDDKIAGTVWIDDVSVIPQTSIQ